MSFKVTRSDPKGSVTNTEVSGEVSAVEGSFTTSKVEPAGSLSYVNINAATSYIRSVFTVSYSSIFAADIQLGLFIIRKTLEDAGLFTDYIDSVAFGKSLFDEVAVVEDLIRATIKKVADDPAYASDLISLRPNKVRNDTARTADLARKGLNKGPIDLAQFSDNTYFGIGRYNLDTARFTELLVRDFSKQLVNTASAIDAPRLTNFKSLADEYFATDSVSAAHNKALLDSASVVTGVPIKGIGYHLYDYVTATDDFFGEANIDDDQNMQFGKLVPDIVRFFDELARQVSFYRDLSDIGAFEDTTSFIAAKFLADTSTTTDDLTYVMGYNKSYYDSYFVTDYTAIGFTLALQDYGAVVESNVKSTGKVNSDLVQITDAGSLFWQDYTVDMTYFAGDYVGDRQLF